MLGSPFTGNLPQSYLGFVLMLVKTLDKALPFLPVLESNGATAC